MGLLSLQDCWQTYLTVASTGVAGLAENIPGAREIIFSRRDIEGVITADNAVACCCRGLPTGLSACC